MLPRFDREGHEAFVVMLLVELLLLVVVFQGIDCFLAAPRSDVVLVGLAQRLLMLVSRAVGLKQGCFTVNQSTSHLA